MNAAADTHPTAYDLGRAYERQNALEEMLRVTLERHRALSRAVDAQAETLLAQGEKIAALEAALLLVISAADDA